MIVAFILQKYIYRKKLILYFHLIKSIITFTSQTNTKQMSSTNSKGNTSVSVKLQARYERYINNFGKYSLDKEANKRPAFTKLIPKVKELCDSKLGKTKVEVIEIVAHNVLTFKGVGQIGATEPIVVEITLKDWFIVEYKKEGMELYPPKVEVEDIGKYKSDDGKEVVDVIDKRTTEETKKKNYIKKLCEDGRNLTSSERSAAIAYGFNVTSYISPFSQQWTVHPNRNPSYLSKVNAKEERKGTTTVYIRDNGEGSMYETSGMTVAEYWNN